MPTQLSVACDIGLDTPIAVRSGSLIHIAQAVTALREFERDVALLRALGEDGEIRLRHRQNGEDYYELVGTNTGLTIGCGQYRDSTHALDLFPGGFAKLYNPHVDREPADLDHLDECKTTANRLALSVHQAGTWEELHERRTAAYVTARDWPREARLFLEERIHAAIAERPSALKRREQQR